MYQNILVIEHDREICKMYYFNTSDDIPEESRDMIIASIENRDYSGNMHTWAVDRFVKDSYGISGGECPFIIEKEGLDADQFKVKEGCKLDIDHIITYRHG